MKRDSLETSSTEIGPLIPMDLISGDQFRVIMVSCSLRTYFLGIDYYDTLEDYEDEEFQHCEECGRELFEHEIEELYFKEAEKGLCSDCS